MSTTLAQGAGALERRVVEFCRALRRAGVMVTPAETIDAARALSLCDISDRREFHDSLRATLIKRPDDYPTFDRVFDAFWEGRADEGDISSSIPGVTSQVVGRVPEASSDKKEPSERSLPSKRYGSAEAPSGEAARKSALAIYSPVERLGTKKFTNLSMADVPEIRRGFKRLARRLATRPGRRMVRSRKGRIDLASTMRASLNTGGELVRPRRMERAISRPRLVVLCDISGSMDAHTASLLKILYLAQNTVPQTKVFTFSTRLTLMEPYLRGRSLWRAADVVSKHIQTWSSGTRIGPALGRLLQEYSALLRSDTVLIVISDGWEVGDLETLEVNLARIRKRVSRIIWLNPLADSPSFRPMALGMKTALPHLDMLAGLRILSNRREFERALGKELNPIPPNARSVWRGRTSRSPHGIRPQPAA